MRKLLDSLSSHGLWFACAVGGLLFALWGGGNLGSNTLTQKTLGDFTAIGLVLAALGILTALRSFNKIKLLGSCVAVAASAIFGGDMPSKLQATTAFVVLAGISLGLAVVVNLFDSDFYEKYDGPVVALFAAIMTGLTAICAGPVMWGGSNAEHAIVAGVIAASAIYGVMSNCERTAFNYIMSALAIACGVWFSLYTHPAPIVLCAILFLVFGMFSAVPPEEESQSARSPSW